MSYEWMSAGLDGALQARSEIPAMDLAPARKEHLFGLMQHLESALEPTGYFRPPDKKPTMVQNLRAVLQRAGFTTSEIHVLRGVIAALERRHEARRRASRDD
jgi:tRNA/rRNA methyltransferase